jgi:hypothetical protein
MVAGLPLITALERVGGALGVRGNLARKDNFKMRRHDLPPLHIRRILRAHAGYQSEGRPPCAPHGLSIDARPGGTVANALERAPREPVRCILTRILRCKTEILEEVEA